MSMIDYRKLVLAAASALVSAGVVWACGPDFPNQLLADRSATLTSVPRNTFAFEAAHLVQAAGAFKASEPDPYDDGAWRNKVAAVENAGLDAVQIKQLDAAAELDGDVAYQRLAGLPEAIRLYAAGAADYHGGSACAAAKAAQAAKGNSTPWVTPPPPAACTPGAAQMDQAAARFRAVLALPPAQRKARAMDAAYMLAHIAQQQFMACDACQGAADAPARRQAIAAQFVALRARALAGAPDPQGLAAASLGDQARLFLHAAGGVYCRWQDFIVQAACPAQVAPDDYRQAIALYAQQAAQGSRSAVDSLRFVAANVLASASLTQGLIDDPLAQRVLVAYALTDGASVDDDDGDTRVKAHLQNLADAVASLGDKAVPDADRLAALAYRTGRYPLAAQFAQRSASPLAWWVRAKLAVRRSDLSAAAADYARAIKALPPSTSAQATLDPANVHLLQGESATLTLARGEYVDALAQFYAVASQVGNDGNDYGNSVGYGYDVSYLAERVLTTDELKAFVDTHATGFGAPPRTAWDAPPLATNLRWLLARRLMRDGRYREALAYFPPQGSLGKDVGDLRQLASDYAAGLHQAAHAWTATGRAEGWYRAAVIAREHGMELLGYEQAPDDNFTGGAFQGGAGLDAKQMQQPYVTAGERERHAQTRAEPDLRLHYRYVAATQASRAADLLPPRSQAFAAVLCDATHWMLEGPPDYNDHYVFSQAAGQPDPDAQSQRKLRAAAYYARYVKQGAYVPWAVHFGQACPAPDFHAARILPWRQRAMAVRSWVREWRAWLAGVGVLVLAGVGIGWWRWRRAQH